MKLLSLLLLSLMISQESFSAIYSTSAEKFVDPRAALYRAKYPQYYSIGFINVHGDANAPSMEATPEEIKNFTPQRVIMRGTGFLINECLIFTNHHIAFAKREAKDINIVSTTFYAGENNEFVSTGKVVTHGGLKVKPQFKPQDWALIKLDKSVYDPKNPKHPRFSWKMPPAFINIRQAAIEFVPEAKDALMVAAYYHDQAESRDGKKLFGQLYCSIWGEHRIRSWQGLWKTDCASIPGTSGAPIFGEKTVKSRDNLQAYGIMVTGEANKADDNFYLPPFDIKKNLGNGMLAFSRMMDEELEWMTEERLNTIIKDNPCP